MLISFRKGAAALAAAVALTAGAAQANEHVVLIVDGGFFPSTIYASEGDVLLFKNESQNSQSVSADDDSWTSGTLNHKQEFELTLTEETPTGFVSASDSEDGIGEIVFQ